MGNQRYRKVKGAEEMTRKHLLDLICPSDKMHNCENYNCVDCNLELIKWLNKYDKHVIEQ